MVNEAASKEDQTNHHVSRRGQVSAEHPTSRREDFSCSRRYAHILRDGRTGQVRVPVCGQEDGRRFHS
jgi:hypothetical protein